MIKRQRFSSNRGSRCLFCLADDPTLLPAVPRFLSHASFIKKNRYCCTMPASGPNCGERVLPGKLVPDEPFDPDIHRHTAHTAIAEQTRSLPPFCPHRPDPSNGQKVLLRAGKPAFSGPVCPLPPAAPHAARSGCGSQDCTPAAPAPRHSRALCCRERIHRPSLSLPSRSPNRSESSSTALRIAGMLFSLRDDEADQHLPLILTQHPDAPAIFHGTLQKVVPACPAFRAGRHSCGQGQPCQKGFPCARLTARVGSAAQWSEVKSSCLPGGNKPIPALRLPSGGESTGRFQNFVRVEIIGSEPFSLPAPLPPSQFQLPVHFAFQRFPKESLPFQCHIAMCAPLLRDAHRTGVQVEIAFAELCPRRNVGVAMQQDIPGASGGRFFRLCT